MRCGATHFRPTHNRGYSSPWTGGHRSLCHLSRVCYLVGATAPNGEPLSSLRVRSTVPMAKPLNIAGRTEHLDIQWGEARGRASFIVIVGLESPPYLIEMDIMRPLRVHSDVTYGTATPAQPDPQTIHLNAAQRHQPQKQLPAPTTSPPPQPQPPREKTAPGASLLAEGTAESSSPSHSDRKIR